MDDPKYVETLQAELQAAKNEAAAALAAKEAAEKNAADAEAALKKAGGPVAIKGTYKGYGFPAGQTRVRNQNGELCDSQLLLDAAKDKAAPGHAAAVETLEWLIKIQYAYFTKK